MIKASIRQQFHEPFVSTLNTNKQELKKITNGSPVHVYKRLEAIECLRLKIDREFL